MKRVFLVLTLLFAQTITFADTETINGVAYSFTVADGKASIYSGAEYHPAIPESTTGALQIPSALGGYPVTSIGEYAFSGCAGLTNAAIPDSVTEIGNWAFSDCVGLTNLTIPNSVTNIGEGAFYGCGGSTSVTIGNSVTDIGEYAFSGCTGLTSVTIPDSVTGIGENAFDGCIGLTSIIIGASVTNIGNWAFCGCSRLASVTMLGAEPSVGEDTFSEIGDGCIAKLPRSGYSKVNGKWQGMTVEILRQEETMDGIVWTFTVGNGEAYLGGGPDSAVRAVPRSTSGAIAIPSTLGGYPVKCIDSSAFYGCTNLTSVTIPDSVTRIFSDAFRDCSSLTSVIIPDSVTRIGDYAFRRCSSLVDIRIPNGPAEYGERCFDEWFLYRTLLNGANGGGGTAAKNEVVMTVTNVVVHYVTTAVLSEAVTPSEDVGIVNIISEVSAGTAVAISSEWAAQYGAAFTEKFGSDFTKAITKPTGKKDSMGNAMYVWQDFVAGTDPTNPDEKFSASITFDADGKPLIAYSPKLSEAETAKRKYTTYGKAKLTDKDWTPVADGDEANYNFFKVSVEMR